MNVKDRLTKLEAVRDDDAVPAITFLIEGEALELFEILQHGGERIRIERQRDESEDAFMMRATAIRDGLIVRSRGTTAAPIPIMFQHPLSGFDESRVTRGKSRA